MLQPCRTSSFKIHYILFVFNFSVDTETSNTNDKCDAGWSQIGRACYQFSTLPMSWSEAQEKCRGEGANLITVTSLYDLVCRYLVCRFAKIGSERSNFFQRAETNVFKPGREVEHSADYYARLVFANGFHLPRQVYGMEATGVETSHNVFLTPPVDAVEVENKTR